MREAGSNAYLVGVPIPRDALEAAAESGRIELRFEVPDALAGGLAIYGGRFGRYPLDPSLVFAVLAER